MKDNGRTESAWLVNDRGAYTRHDYHGVEVVRFVGLTDVDGGEAVALLYRCRETNAVRRWGLETLGRHGLGNRDGTGGTD